MFYFFHSAQNASNARYYKGLLFEDLLRRFLDVAGYDCKLERSKFNSLEYDIIGSHRIDSRNIVGEAKAHDDTITGEAVSSFIGKFSPHHFQLGGNVSGLFLSTSPLSPDAEDFLQKVKDTSPFRVERHSGSSLEKQIKAALRLPSETTVNNLLVRASYRIHATHLLHTDQGTFVVAVASTLDGGFPDRFAVINASDHLVADASLLGRLRENVAAFQELDPILPPDSKEPTVKSMRADVPEGLITATDWLDFRHPAGPDFFIGRSEALQKAGEIVASSRSGAIIEIKSRSGVGKSSLLAAMSERWKRNGDVIELHDARDVHSAVDVLRLVERFAKLPDVINEFEHIAPALERLAGRMSGQRAVFIVDQFEATFQTPEVFRAYEYLAMCIVRGPKNLAMVFARKDDLLTTHDDLQIDIERIRNLSSPIALDDFSRPEAFDLLVRISEEFPKKINSQILSQVLEFAQGFPWLLKRTMAHVSKSMRQKVSQQELLSSGLHLVDLFEEELAELDEIERGYLTRIVGTLPATYHALMQRYESDPQLPRMLEKLTHRKILRFSAGTYDTYNDVFKDFLLYDRLPERSQSALFKMGPVTVSKAFRALGGRNTIDVAAFGETISKTQGGTYNTLRELRLAGLVARTPHGWVVPQVVRDYEHQNRLGEYVRQSLLKNGAVSIFLSDLEAAGAISFDDVKAFLREHFPFTQAKEVVWDSYARTFISWLQVLLFITADEVGNVAIVHHGEESISERLGNLYLHGRGSRPRQRDFLPTKELSTLERLLHRVALTTLRPSSLSRGERLALVDLVKLKAADFDADKPIQALMTPERFKEHVSQLMSSPPYTEFWLAIKSGNGFLEAITKIFGLSELAESTRMTFAVKLVNWGRRTGNLPSKRLAQAGGRLTSSRQKAVDSDES